MVWLPTSYRSHSRANSGLVENEFTDDLRQVWGIGFQSGQCPQMGDSCAKLVVPVVEQCSSGGMEERIPPHVAPDCRPGPSLARRDAVQASGDD